MDLSSHTPLEVWLRLKGGDSGYGTDFIEQYVLSVLYPVGLTHDMHLVLGSLVVAVNVAVYSYLWRRARKTSVAHGTQDPTEASR